MHDSPVSRRAFTELAIVGAGPGGLAAAIEAADSGVDTVLIDSEPRPGGQYYRQTPQELEGGGSQDQPGGSLFRRLNDEAITVLTETVVWGIFAEGDGYLLCLYGPSGTPRRLTAKKVILAPGAYDRPTPFPGWTLPGVITAGAALNLVKHQHVLPGRRILLNGTGPLQLLLAQRLIESGAEVAAVLDANPFPWQGWHHVPAAWGQWERLGEGWRALQAMRKARTPLRWGHTVRAAHGNGQVERAVVGPLAGGRTRVLEVDTICLGYGLIPSVQLSRQLGCAHQYDGRLRAYLPVRDDALKSTVPGVFIAGDGGGIGGKDVAQWEGRLAAIGAARELNRPVRPARLAEVRSELARQRRFAEVLADLFPPPAGLGCLLTDDTVLCRCEEVTVGDIRRTISEGATTLNAIRMVTRAGMGRCQGRMCSSSVAELLAGAQGRPVPSVGEVTPRPPVVPIPLEGLLEEGMY